MPQDVSLMMGFFNVLRGSLALKLKLGFELLQARQSCVQVQFNLILGLPMLSNRRGPFFTHVSYRKCFVDYTICGRGVREPSRRRNLIRGLWPGVSISFEIKAVALSKILVAGCNSPPEISQFRCSQSRLCARALVQ